MSEKEAPVEAPAEQKSSFVFILFYALGLVTYIPQSFYITATDYWMYKFRDPNAVFNESDTSGKTELQTNFAAYYSIVGSVSTISMMLLTTIFIRKVPVHMRCIGCISIQLFLFIITNIFVWVDTDTWQKGFLVVAMIIAALVNGTGACYMLSVFELSARYSSLYLGALITGQALGGVVAALVQIITLAMQTSSRVTACIYFVLGAIFIATVEILYIFTFIVKKKDAQGQPIADTKETEKKVEFNRKNIFRVARKVIQIPLITLLVQGATVMVHPGVTVLVESTANAGKWSDVFYVPFVTYFLHNTCDFIGREVATRWKKPDRISIILIAGMIRVGFVPLFIFCNVQPRNHLPVVFGPDYFYIIFTVIFSFTNGYFVNLGVVKLSSLCNPEEMKIATSMLVLVLVVSLSCFSFMSKLIISLI